jgi:hypothetical protein
MKTPDPGTWFLVPIVEGVFALGLVARRSHRGALFGYFFRTTATSPKEALQSPLPSRGQHVLCGRFADVGLQSGEWPILHRDSAFNPDEWPMPPFVRKDDATGTVMVSEYDPETFRCVKEVRGDESALASLPYDRMMGHVAVAKRLRGLLGSA